MVQLKENRNISLDEEGNVKGSLITISMTGARVKLSLVFIPRSKYTHLELTVTINVD